MSDRVSGILLHPTSLPGPECIGDLGSETLETLDWMELAGQSVWQLLPLGPVGLGNSPYNCGSSFAGNPLLISISSLLESGYFPFDRPAPPPGTDPWRVDYSQAREWKQSALNLAWAQLQKEPMSAARDRFAAWCEAPHQDHWLNDWALFRALQRQFNGQSWTDWPAAVRTRQPTALLAAAQENEEEIERGKFEQFLFFEQWGKLRDAAAARGVELLGDLPFYVALDSCDVWSRPELFKLDAAGQPKVVAGVPPDYFSPTGQRWGNPIYDWQRLEAEGFRWWIDRLTFQSRLFDRLRIDHFRGFAGYWEIPADRPTAEVGTWCQGPGRELFQAAAEELAGFPLVAENLGVITPEVESLRQELGIPGMKILQFAFDETDSSHLPHHTSLDNVIYTSTHDNDTATGWFAGASAETQQRARDYLGSDAREIHWDLIRSAWTSRAVLAITPLQDLLGLDGSHRMNTPGTAEGNWEWRLPPDLLGEETASRLKRLTELSGRLPVKSATEP